MLIFAAYILIYVTHALNRTIHFVPHSHDDLGWQNTMEEYFYKVNKYGSMN